MRWAEGYSLDRRVLARPTRASGYRLGVDEATARLLTWVDAHGVPPRHDEVEDRLLADGWTLCGEGDWARAYRSPTGPIAARVSSFDPACAFTVRLYREGTWNRYLPRLDAHRNLDGGGQLMVMELLAAMPGDEARGLAPAPARPGGAPRRP